MSGLVKSWLGVIDDYAAMMHRTRGRVLADHALGGAWRGFRDCHVKPDLVLIYRKSADALALARLGSHSELFG